MSLDVAKLEMVRRLEGGIVRARCPACAEVGQDRAGNHLRILADGRFGCCVHPKDRDHRKRIFALAGCKLHLRSPGTFTVRVGGQPTIPASRSVKAALTASRLGTLGTGKTDCETGVPGVPNQKIHSLGTLGTPLFNPYAYRKNILPTCKDLETAVPGVPSSSVPELGWSPTGAVERLPFLTADGTLSIPFDSPARYHWWRGGQSVAQTRAEVLSRLAAIPADPDSSA